MTHSDHSSPDKKQPARLLRSFVCAFHGLASAWKSELHIRVHFVIAIAVIAAGACFQISPIEWGLIVFAISLVFTTELLNTAIEKTLDRISDEIHPLTKSAKDIAAGAVFISAFGAATVGLLIFLPRLLEMFL